MKGPTLGVLLALLCGIAGNSQATFDYATGPGTVQHVLSRPDGARVSLTMVLIGRIDTSQRQGISVHEWWDKTTSIAVLFDPTLGLKTGQTIDIEGTMTTLPGGKRAVVCERIALYLDKFGYVVPGVPPLKGLLDPSVWPFRGWIPVQQAAFAGMSTLGMTLLGEFQPPLARDGIPGVAPMSISSPSSSDGSWVYLTGQVVTYIGQYYSYDLAEDGWMNVYYLQGIDRTPGMRVWIPASYNPSYIGSIVDVMAKVDTRDGQRMLGIWSDDELDAIDLSSSTHCIEPKILADGDYYDPLNVVPVGIINRDLGGATMGNNPGVTGSLGLYNIGSYVTTWGKVLETGTYEFDQYPTTPYMIIDDGSDIYGNNQDITVFGANSFGYDDPAEVGDHVSVTGVSSIWKPSGSTPTYRSIWTSDYAVNQADPSTIVAREVTSTGTISGTVKLYDMPTGLPNNQAAVNVYCTHMHMTQLLVTRQTNGSGSASYSFADVPKAVEVTTTEPPYTYTEYPQYIVSAKCDDYKTRTYTGVTPWSGTATPRNIYLPRLRKIYVMADHTTLDSCSGGSYPTSTVVTATVKDSDHNPIQGLTVRFRTDNGSFSTSSVVHDYTPTSTTNAQGQVTATLYGVPSESGYGTVEATDDSAPLAGDDPDDDPYDYDWEQLHDQYGQPITITINQPSAEINPYTASHSAIDLCGNITSTIMATVSVCGSGLDGVDVTFDTSLGKFSDNSTQKVVTTQNGGVASVVFKGDGTTGTATVSASAQPYGITINASTEVDITTDALTLTANPVAGQVGQSVTVTANVKDAAGNNVSGRRVYLSQTGGSMTSPTSGYADTNSSGNASAVITRSTVGKVTVTAYEDMSCATRVTEILDVWFYDTTPEDWPMFMHDPQHTGMSKTWDVSDETLTRQWVVDLPTASTIRTQHTWSVQIGQDTIYHPNPASTATFIFEHPYIDSSPVVVGNKVVVGTWDGDYLSATGSVKAFNAANNGATLWTATGTPSMGGVASTPCISDGKIFVGTTNGYLYCLDLDGNQFWARQTTDRSATPGSSRIISSPVAHNGVVYITNEASKVYAFTADSNGTLVAGYPIVLPIDQSGHGDGGNGVTGAQQNVCGASSPGIATVGENTYLLVGCDDGYVYRIKLSDRTLASLNMGGCVEASPSISGNHAYIGVSIYLGEDLQRITIEDSITSDLEHSGSWELGEESRATASLAYDYAYNGVDTGHIFYRVHDPATDPVKGDLPQYVIGQEYYPTWYFVGSAAHTTGGIAYTGNDNGRFYALDADDLHSLVTQQAVDGYYDTGIQSPDFICSSPAIGYNVDANHNRWVFVTTRSDGGKLYAFKTIR